MEVGMETHIIGWISSLILVPSLMRQTYKQWREGTSEGVSHYLYLGSLASSTGFVIYSALLKNWVFLVTNGMLVINNAVGLFVLYRHRKQGE